MKRCVLVTGAAGFVGNVLSDHLVKQGWQVSRTDLNVPPSEDGWYACDIADAGQVDGLFSWAGAVTHVFHLAAVTFVPEARRAPAKTFSVNLLGTVNLIAAAKAHAPKCRVINVSSSAVYGPPQELPVTEAHPLNPVEPYAIAKAAADQYCGFAHEEHGLDIIRIRPFNHSGPGQDDSFVLSSFARQIARIEAGKREPVLRVGNLKPRRDFLHVRDVVRGYECAALKGESGGVYNICSGRAVAIGDALEMLLEMSDTDIQVETDPGRLRNVEVLESRGSHEALTADTGWEPEAPLATLLEELLTYWREVESA